MRKNIVAGNWKMNLTHTASSQLVTEISKHIKELDLGDNSVMVFPPFVNIASAQQASNKDERIVVGAQNMHQATSGAFTGEISAEMLQSIGVSTVLLGHSERRTYFWETNELLAKKVTTALANNMTIIFCFGEELEDRKSGNHFNVAKEQLQEGLFHITEKDWSNIVLAYEPVWAIGTGETASPEQAQEMHKFIRNTVLDAYSEEISQQVSILYGGSVKPNNATEIFGQPDVDGGLIGGASLKAEDFTAIIKAI